MTTNQLPDDLNPAIIEATATFIGQITGMVPPPTNAFPPEWYDYLRTFTSRMYEVAGENAPAAEKPNADRPTPLDPETVSIIRAFVDRPGETYRRAITNRLGIGFGRALRRAIEESCATPEAAAYAKALRAVESAQTITQARKDVRALRDEARAALPSDAAQAPEGWKLVPVECTPEMFNAGQACGGYADRVYRVMIKAAPVAPQAAGDAAQAPQVTRYFVYDPENGLEEYATDQEREKAHAEAIEPYLDDGWSEEVENVVSGVITHVTLKNTIAPNPGHTNCSCDECHAYREAGGTDEWSEICNYRAAPVAPAAQQDARLIGWWDTSAPSGFRWKEGIVRADYADNTPIYAVAPAAAAPKTAEPSNLAWLIERDCCEYERADPDAEDTICISVGGLHEVVNRHVAEMQGDAPAFPDENSAEFDAGCAMALKASEAGIGPCGVFIAGYRALRGIATDVGEPRKKAAPLDIFVLGKLSADIFGCPLTPHGAKFARAVEALVRYDAHMPTIAEDWAAPLTDGQRKAEEAAHRALAATDADRVALIHALQKALAYWMPQVFDERSAHDAYLLVGYEGEDEPSYWEQRAVATLTPEAILAAFERAGMRLDPTPNALYTVRGQHAQLIEGVRTLLAPTNTQEKA